MTKYEDTGAVFRSRYCYAINRLTKTQRERQRDRETERQRDRETETQRDRETQIHRDRETERKLQNVFI
jgi:hypothetical protein